jgi:hypothetical protein
MNSDEVGLERILFLHFPGASCTSRLKFASFERLEQKLIHNLVLTAAAWRSGVA